MGREAAVIPDEILISKIYLIRGQKVMLDFHLSELYGVQTKVLKQAVRRNIYRFPEDFMFELSKQEFEDLRSQFVTSNRGGIRYMPMAFTEHGVLMLSSVLKSRIAIELNIHIVRVFSKMRQMLANQKEIIIKLKQMEDKITNHDFQLSKLFDAIKELLLDKIAHTQPSERKQIGFKK
ncbi:MAG: ORF6N domain-containing protein [Saprospiraceae bacterium]